MSDRSYFTPGYQQVAGRAARRQPTRTPGRPVARQIARPMGVPRTAWSPSADVPEETQGMGHPPAVEDETIPQEVALAFAPLHKRAFGIAVGTACGLMLFLITIVSMLREPGHPSGLH